MFNFDVLSGAMPGIALRRDARSCDCVYSRIGTRTDVEVAGDIEQYRRTTFYEAIRNDAQVT